MSDRVSGAGSGGVPVKRAGLGGVGGRVGGDIIYSDRDGPRPEAVVARMCGEEVIVWGVAVEDV